MLNLQTGNIGETIAYNYLKKNHYKDIKLNVRNQIGEIDIIAKDQDYIVFIEVKTRSSLKFGYPKEAVDKRKQQKIVKTATAYLKNNGLLDKSVRFDVIEVLGDEKDYDINHIQNAF